MSRKDEHVQLALKQTPIQNDFDTLRLIHHSLEAVNVDSVNYRTQIGSLILEHPFYINAMTGGSEFTKKINRDLAIIAKETNLMMAVGSMSAFFKDPSSKESFSVVRQMNPEGLILANLNLNHSISDAKECLALLQADGIQFHINSPQEITMGEGDRHFDHWKDNIKHFNSLDTNVIIKEVGFGMSEKTIETLIQLDTKIIDVSGKGGTNFITIENQRHQNHFDYLQSWGQSTVESLLNAQKFKDQATFIASGGIRNPLDVVKALVLKSEAVGVSKTFLSSLMEVGIDETICLIKEWQVQIKLIMALLGAKTIKDLHQVDYLITKK